MKNGLTASTCASSPSKEATSLFAVPPTNNKGSPLRTVKTWLVPKSRYQGGGFPF